MEGWELVATARLGHHGIGVGTYVYSSYIGPRISTSASGSSLVGVVQDWWGRTQIPVAADAVFDCDAGIEDVERRCGGRWWGGGGHCGGGGGRRKGGKYLGNVAF